MPGPGCGNCSRKFHQSFTTNQKQIIEHPRCFLFRIARNLALDYLKHKKVTENYSQSQDPTLIPVTESPSLEQLTADTQKLKFLSRVIDHLPARCRQVFIMHNVHCMSYREIASELEISESGVEKHIMKGLLRCRKEMKKWLPT
ncbi:MAG: RNA polymerase sigma factor [Methylococcaceae bacterium]